MAINLHNSVAKNTSSASSLTATGFTAAIGEIVVVKIIHESTSGNPVRTVSSISDGTANVYAKRFSASQSPEPQSSAAEGYEVWWAYAANPLSAATITVAMSGAIDDAVVIVAGYQGFTGTAYQTAPWDANGSLPATAQSSSSTNSFGAVSGVSTTSTAGMLLAGLASVTTSALPDGPSSFTLLQQQINNGAVLSIQGALWDLAYSSAQSSATFNWGPGGSATKGWIAYIDALTIPTGGGGTQTLTPSLFTDGDTFFAPTVTRGPVTLAPSLYSDADTFFAPTVSPGAVTLTPSLFTDADSFFAPTVTQGPITLSPALYTDPDTFFSATVTTGPVSLTPSLFTDPDTFFAPSVVAKYSLAPGLFTDADTFFAPIVSPGPVTLTPGLFTDADAFFSPIVSGSGPSTVTLLPDLYTDPDTFFPPIVTVATGTAFDCSFDFDAFDNDTACDTRNVFGVSFIGGIGHYKWELEEAKRLAAITTRGPPGFVDLRSPVRFDPIGGPPSAPAAPAPDLAALAQQQVSAQMQAAQAAKKRRRDIEAILLLAA